MLRTVKRIKALKLESASLSAITYYQNWQCQTYYVPYRIFNIVDINNIKLILFSISHFRYLKIQFNLCNRYRQKLKDLVHMNVGENLKQEVN